MEIDGWYYLHINGKMIYKGSAYTDVADLRESDMVKMFWPFTASDRCGAWSLLVEALASGADPDRVKELAEKWGCNDKDAEMYCSVIGVDIELDGGSWCAHRQDFINLQESNAGFGETILDALAHLCKDLGYKPQKMWGTTFEKLVSE